jgi:hypothetical protein
MVDRTSAPMKLEERRNNRRTAWILASIVLVFFIGVFVRRWLT